MHCYKGDAGVQKNIEIKGTKTFTDKNRIHDFLFLSWHDVDYTKRIFI